MVKERLEAGEQEHQSGVEVALPKRGIFVPHETQKETGKDNSDFWYQTLDSPSEALAVACFIYMMSSEFHSVGVIFFFFSGGNLLLFDFAIADGKPALLRLQGLHSSAWPEAGLPSHLAGGPVIVLRQHQPPLPPRLWTVV